MYVHTLKTILPTGAIKIHKIVVFLSTQDLTHDNPKPHFLTILAAYYSLFCASCNRNDCPPPPQCSPQTKEATAAALANTPAANPSENVPPRFNSHHHHQYRHRRSRDSDVCCKEIIIFSPHQIIQSNHVFQKIPVHTTGLISSLMIRWYQMAG